MNAPAPIILHIAAAAAWDEAVRRGVYSADSLAAEGFIHCSDARQLVAVANRLFRGRTDLVLLRVDASKLDAPVRYENLEGGTELFPHVYGPLPTSAVVEAVPFLPDGDGGFHDGPLRDLLDAGARPRRDPSARARTSDDQ